MLVVCCNECFRNIAKKDTKAAKLWLDLCAYFFKARGNLKLREYNVPWLVPQFRNLESLGYIATADDKDAINIRVNGYDIVEMKKDNKHLETFCIDREKHGDSWV